MINCFFTNRYQRLFKSLQRFTKYTCNKTLYDYNKIDAKKDHKLKIFICKDECENPGLLRVISDNFGRGNLFISLGYNDNSSVNLFDFANLHSRLQQVFEEKYVPDSPLFTEQELKEKISRFFKSHGQESLFDGLNWVRYYLKNGTLLLLQEEITIQEYQSKFYIPLLQYWDEFTTRFSKYKVYLKFLGYSSEINRIKKNTAEFGKFIENRLVIHDIQSISFNKQVVQNHTALLKELDNILTGIARDLEIGDQPVQNIGGG